MSNLRERINAALDVYDEYNVPEEMQIEILARGVDAKISSYGTPLYRHFNFVRFAEFINYMQNEWCDSFGERFDVNGFLMASDHTGYTQPLQLFAYYEKKRNMRKKDIEDYTKKRNKR